MHWQPLGLSSILILTIDLGTELCPAMSLSYEDMVCLTASDSFDSRCRFAIIESDCDDILVPSTYDVARTGRLRSSHGLLVLPTAKLRVVFRMFTFHAVAVVTCAALHRKRMSWLVHLAT